jgi:hypothetical protein
LESVKKYQDENSDKYLSTNLESVKKYQAKQSASSFPPLPPSLELQHTIISNFCDDMSPNQFIEYQDVLYVEVC